MAKTMTTENRNLKFSKANTKISKLYKIEALQKFLYDENNKERKIYSFDLLAGKTCPFANECKAWVVENVKTGKRTIRDGKHCRFRCYAASLEAIYGAVYEQHRHNTSVLKNQKTPEQFHDIILENLPKNAGIIRLHSSGDFFSLNYFLGWLLVAESRPDILIYCYTKSIKYLKYANMISPRCGKIRENFLVTGSLGGKCDDEIDKIGIRSVDIVFSEEEAKEKSLKIDNDDSHAATSGGSFALLIHGVQPKGTKASKALYQIMRKK